MNIQIKNDDIVNAIRAHLPTMGINVIDCDITVSFTRSRQAGGFAADISITPSAKPAQVDVEVGIAGAYDAKAERDI